MKKISYLLSIFVVPCSFALNLSHSLNNYGFSDASLPVGIRAQTSSSGSTSDDIPPSTDPAFNCRTMEGATDWKYITCADPRFPFGQAVISSSSVVFKCSNFYTGLQNKCRSGTKTVSYHYNSSVSNGCFNPVVEINDRVRDVTCETPSN